MELGPTEDPVENRKAQSLPSKSMGGTEQYNTMEIGCCVSSWKNSLTQIGIWPRLPEEGASELGSEG